MFKNISKEWIEVLNKDLDPILEAIGTNIVPGINDIFNFARLTPLDKINVVILGQDPYPTKGHANGLAFSCNAQIPPSLKNIYKCLLHNGLITEIPTVGDLTSWAKQGVLLLNCSLTTVPGKSNAHSELWADYTDRIIEYLAELKKPMIFLLWGNYAKAKKHLMKKCYVFEWTHPSPLAQAKQSFIDCDGFTKANQILVEHGLKPINWNITDGVKNIVTPVEHFSLHDRKVLVFTDGSAWPNKKSPACVAGYAACFAYGPFTDVIMYGNLDRTIYASNNRAEGMAIWNVMKYLNKKENFDKWTECTIVTDSEFWVNMFVNYMPKWDRLKLDFNKQENPDITIPVYNLYCKLQYEKHITFEHMKSHDKNQWSKKPDNSYEKFCYEQNCYVDKLAGYARRNIEEGKNIIDMAEHEN